MRATAVLLTCLAVLGGCAPAPPPPAVTATPTPVLPERLVLFDGLARPRLGRGMLCVLDRTEHKPYLVCFRLDTGRSDWKVQGTLGILSWDEQGLFTWSRPEGGPLEIQRRDPDSGKPVWKRRLALPRNFGIFECSSSPRPAGQLAISWTISPQPTGTPPREGTESGAVLLSTANGKIIRNIPPVDPSPNRGLEEFSPGQSILKLDQVQLRLICTSPPGSFQLHRQLQASDAAGREIYNFELPVIPDLQSMRMRP